MSRRLRQAPYREPAVHLSGLLLLRGGDIIGQQPDFFVICSVPDEHAHLNGLGVMDLHVAGKPCFCPAVKGKRLGGGEPACSPAPRQQQQYRRRSEQKPGRVPAPGRRRLRAMGHDVRPGASIPPVQGAPGSGALGERTYLEPNNSTRGSSTFSTPTWIPHADIMTGDAVPSRGESTV